VADRRFADYELTQRVRRSGRCSGVAPDSLAFSLGGLSTAAVSQASSDGSPRGSWTRAGRLALARLKLVCDTY